MPRLSRAEEARARLAAVRASPPAPRPEEEESLLNYAGRRLQLAAMPAVALSEKDLLSVYEPSDDTFLLLDALEADRSLLRAVSPALCIELGCGSGVVLSALAKMMLAGGGGGGGCCRCVGTDINAAALGVARRTAALNGVGTVVELVQGDLLSCFRRFQFRPTPSLYDVLVFNPPYVPSEPDEIGLDCSWAPKISAAWAGGLHGREVIDRLLPQLPHAIAPGGLVYMVLEAQNKPREVVKRLASLGFSGACIRETAVVHEEAPEQLGIWRFVRDGKGARLAEEEEEGERDQQAGLDMADVNLPPAPSVEALTEDEGDVEEAGEDHSECALWMQEVPTKAGLRDVRRLLGETAVAGGGSGVDGLSVVYRLDDDTVAAEYRDRTTTVAAARALAGSQLLGEMLTVGLPVPLREGE